MTTTKTSEKKRLDSLADMLAYIITIQRQLRKRSQRVHDLIHTSAAGFTGPWKQCQYEPCSDDREMLP